MKTIFISFCFLACLFASRAQKCPDFFPDTIMVPGSGKSLSGEYLQANLKNGSMVRFYKTIGGKLFLKLIVTENLYFDKTDKLEIQSGSKSFYAKDVTQLEMGKATGYYVIEIFKNYVGTLKEDGITGIVFGKVETSFTRQDASQIRQIAKCFYESIDIKK